MTDHRMEQRSGAQRFTWPAHARFRRHRASFTCGPVDDTPTFECHPHVSRVAMPWMIRYSTVCAPTQHQFVVTYANGPLPRAVPPYRERNLRATTEHSMLVLPNTPCWC